MEIKNQLYRCSKCLEFQLRVNFHKKNNKLGIRNVCKNCRKIDRAAYYLNNKEKEINYNLMHLRYTDMNRRFVSLKKIAKVGIEALDAHFWTEFGPFETNVIYGHHVHSMKEISIVKYDNGTACYGIDTGCCFGGQLTALIWETKEVVQVKAEKEYVKKGFD